MSVSTTEAGPVRRTGLPMGVYIISFALFAMGSAEFLLAGVLPAVAADLDISLASAGGLITAFAVGVVIGGPPLAAVSLGWPRRTALVVSQALFALAVAAGLVTDHYPVLVGSRFVAGLAYAGFCAVAAVTAVSFVTPDRHARASAVVISGLSLAMVVGGPAGAMLGYLAGWRAGFWGVVALTVMGMVAVLLSMPSTRSVEAPDLAGELRTMRQPQLWCVYAATLLSTAGYMITFNFLAALLTGVTKVPDIWVPPILALFGVGAFIGLSIGGRLADRRPFAALFTGIAGILLFSLLLAALSSHLIPAVTLVLLLGISGFVLNPAIYGRVFAIAATAPTLAGATTVSAFQLGISIVPILAAAAFHVGAGLQSLGVIGGLLALATVPAVAADRRLTRRDAPTS